MKIIIVYFVAIFLVLFSFSFALAENTNDSNVSMLISAPVADDLSSVSDVSSGAVFWKEVGLWFTFNQERKMEKEMELAQMRLQQAEFATVHNRTQNAEKALEAYGKLIERVNKRGESIRANNASVGALKLAAMDQAILAHQQRLMKISDDLNNANLTEEQRVRLEERFAHAENVTGHLQEVQSEREEKIKARLMAEGNLSESEAENRIEKAKENAEEMVNGARKAWNDFKDEAKSNNMTPKEFAKERMQETRAEIKSSDFRGPGSEVSIQEREINRLRNESLNGNGSKEQERLQIQDSLESSAGNGTEVTLRVRNEDTLGCPEGCTCGDRGVILECNN